MEVGRTAGLPVPMVFAGVARRVRARHAGPADRVPDPESVVDGDRQVRAGLVQAKVVAAAPPAPPKAAPACLMEIFMDIYCYISLIYTTEH